ncbi:unnamed protein product, partial [Heterosigma akashiwo]
PSLSRKPRSSKNYKRTQSGGRLRTERDIASLVRYKNALKRNRLWLRKKSSPVILLLLLL